MPADTVLTILAPSMIETEKMARAPLSAEMLLRLADPLKDVRRSLLLLDDAAARVPCLRVALSGYMTRISETEVAMSTPFPDPVPTPPSPDPGPPTPIPDPPDPS
jgi:hypothetical protein